MGVAGTISISTFKSADAVNKWLQGNADKEVIDIRYSRDEFIIIHRKED